MQNTQTFIHSKRRETKIYSETVKIFEPEFVMIATFKVFKIESSLLKGGGRNYFFCYTYEFYPYMHRDILQEYNSLTTIYAVLYIKKNY